MKKGYFFVALAGLLSGTIIFGGAVFAKLGLSLFEIALFRTAFSLLLLPYLIYKKELHLPKKLLKILIIFGFIEACAVLLEFAPVVLGVPVAIAVLLLYTAPLWTVVLSKFFFNEKITKSKIIGIILVIIGIIILVNPFQVSGSINLIGALLALAAGVFLSLWTIFGKLCGEENSHPVKTQFYTVLFTLLFLTIFYPIMSFFLKQEALISFSLSHSINIWIYLALFAVISNIVPHVSYYHGIKEIPASTAGIILLLEPLSGAILAALFLSQAITLNIFIGGLFILLANYIVIKSESDGRLVEAEVIGK